MDKITCLRLSLSLRDLHSCPLALPSLPSPLCTRLCPRELSAVVPGYLFPRGSLSLSLLLPEGSYPDALPCPLNYLEAAPHPAVSNACWSPALRMAGHFGGPCYVLSGHPSGTIGGTVHRLWIPQSVYRQGRPRHILRGR